MHVHFIIFVLFVIMNALLLHSLSVTFSLSLLFLFSLTDMDFQLLNIGYVCFDSFMDCFQYQIIIFGSCCFPHSSESQIDRVQLIFHNIVSEELVTRDVERLLVGAVKLFALHKEVRTKVPFSCIVKIVWWVINLNTISFHFFNDVKTDVRCVVIVLFEKSPDFLFRVTIEKIAESFNTKHHIRQDLFINLYLIRIEVALL